MKTSAQYAKEEKDKIASDTKKVKSTQVKSVKAKAGKKKATISWKKNTTFAGYQISYKKAGAKAKTVKVTKNTTIKKVVTKLTKGKKYTKLLDEMITTAIKDYKNSKKKVTSFESNVLSTYDGSKGNKTKMQ